ncbi:Sodium:neurotransmitter symporter, partial [Trinorchestia longiramus]
EINHNGEPEAAVFKTCSEQGVEALMAAVEQLDKTVDHLCELSTDNDYSDRDFNKNKLVTMTQCAVEIKPQLPTVPALPNDSLREFSAIHELCQASTSSKPKTLPDDLALDELPVIQMEGKEKYEPYALHEAINENCHFSNAGNENVKEKSFQHNELSDSQSSLESLDSSSSNCDDREQDDCSVSMEDGVACSEEAEVSLSSDTEDDKGLVSTVTNVVRRSLRRVKRFRNSFGKSRKSSSVDREVKSEERNDENSEELDQRRRLPINPRVGLPSVRSPSTSAVLLPSIVASLAPPDVTHPKISSPRETLAPLFDSPTPRRDASRSGPDSFRNPPPLSPTRHIPANLSSSSFRSTNSGATSPALSPIINNGHRSLCTSPINSPPNYLSTSNTLPSNQRRSSNLLNLTTSFRNQHDPFVSLYPIGHPEPNTRTSNSNHNRSSSAPDRDSSQSSISRYPSSQADITSVLVSPLRLTSGNTTSPSRRSASSGGRTVSPRRTQRSSDEPSDGRRSRTPQRTGGRRDRNQSRRNGRSSTVPSSPASSSSSGRSAGHGVSTNPSATEGRGVHSRPLPGTCSDNASRRSSANNSDGRSSENGSSSTAGGGSSHRAERTPRRRQRPPTVTCSEDQDVWPHHHSGLMASLAVTVTVFNISRFAVLGAAFGWPFLVQWLIISLVLGVPLLTLHVALGQHTGLGALQLWKVAPIFQGVGVSLVLAQLILGVYCSVPIAWLCAYFRDSFFFYTDQDAFSWTSCRKLYPGVSCSSEANLSAILPMSVPRYLSWHVQQRSVGSSTWQESLGSLKFSLTFNVVLIWLLTFVALCKGNRVYGKVSYVIFIVPLLCFLAVCVYIASWTREDLSLIPDFARAFMNSKSWVAASREVFLVWGLHGPVLQQMTVHNRRGQSIKSHVWLLVLTTVLVLVLASVTGSCCAASFSHIGLKYSPSSFEKPETAQFLVPIRDPNASFDPADGSQTDVRTSSNALAPHGALWEDMYNARGDRDATSNTDDGLIHVLYDKLFFLASQLMVSHMRYDSLYVGIRISFPQLGTLYGLLYDNMLSMEKPDHLAHGPWKRPSTPEWGRSPLFRKSRVHDKSRSGYQSLRLATELFPAFVGVHGAQQIPPVWATLFYLSLLLLGIAQQLAVWRTLVEIVISSTGLQRKRSLVTACCCLVGLSASLPLASQLGPDLLYFLDYIIGCAWWLMILQLVQVFAILFVRGKPVSAQDIVSSIAGGRQASRVPGWSVHVSAFACSILVPVGLLVLSISSFKSGQYREVFTWSSNGYWPVWASQIASGLQLFPILLVPLVALAQTCRFLANTRYDLFQRIQLLYRPAFVPRMHPRPPTPPLSPIQRREDAEAGEADPNYSTSADSTAPYTDPPPKYTPPPSYSTATG